MRLALPMLLPLAACFDFPSSSSTPTPCVGLACETDDESEEEGSEEEEPDEEVPDEDVPSTCEGVTYPSTPLTWERSSVVPTWSSDDLTCAAVDFDSWDLRLEWSVSSIDGFLMNPVVSPQDGADWSTVFVERGGAVDLYDGRDGSLIRTIDFGGMEEDGSTPAVGDADGDGDLEFVTTTWSTLRIEDLGTGAVTSVPQLDRMSPADEVSAWVDADGDGNLDVLIMDSTWTLDGTNLAALNGGLESTGIFAADLDQDGAAEVVTASGIYSALDGTGTDWDPDDVSEPGYALYGGPVRDGDETLLWFNLGTNSTYQATPDGEVVGTSGIGGERWLASIGDVDGDGAPEMCVFDGATGDVVMLTLDGAALWSWTVGRAGLAGGCTMADLDADGSYEVLLNTSDGLVILDGATGVALAEEPDTASMARDSAPIVADIDGDGSAEILVGSGFDLRVYGAARGQFARTRPVWNQLAYDITSVQDDGTLVSWPLPSWEAYNAFRAQPAHDGDHPDLRVEVLDTCIEDCDDGAVQILVRISNLGSAEAAPGAVLSLRTVDSDGPSELATMELDEALASGDAVEAWIWTDVADLGARIAVDITSADEDECDMVNNRVMVRLACDGG